MNKNLFSIIAAFTLLSLFSHKANAASLIAMNFDNLSLGAAIVGPVGPFVETSLIKKLKKK
ncbi:MAG: hypothetical protein VKN72_15900 [Nostocales cyanobacterium 94392]|nr:hypothetical protein [Nostocales cyanobacterium 94392]